ncbi:signal peptidase I [Microbacterium sp. ARD31]|uniref:signal peptidase I n=1 Tax=Microbacterium sp. ARD31 TaxID=2962576 RepID=UPI00288143F9|nr:signal peptidase I [Microbacterium sp. ARD31]MDT0184854.1 signal peptidase I [Microbacterium sp. ARD31]
MSAGKTARTAGNAIVTIVAIVGTAIAALMFVPSLFGLDRYVITGGSMSGTFERGALVFERQVPVSDLREGDIITYLPPSDSGITELVTHRIVSITASTDPHASPTFQTRGDANDSVDPWTFTLASAVQPRVDGWLPEVGWVFIALAQPGIRMLAIGVPAALIGLLFLKDLMMAWRRPDSPAAGAAAVTDGDVWTSPAGPRATAP